MNKVKEHIDPGTQSSAASRPIRLLLAAGGTGGHVYPAISIADAVRSLHSGSEILFVGTRDRMEWQTVPNAGYNIKSVWISGFHRRLTPQNLLFPFKLVTSLLQSVAILKRFKPDIVVSCGGFAAGPVGWVAGKMGIPLAIQEQNSYPGVTNRILSRQAVKIFTAFEAAEKYLPEEKIELTGNPVRGSLKVQDRKTALEKFTFDTAHPVLLVLGGSGGAKALNDIMSRYLELIHDEMKIQVIWQCGDKYYDELATEIETDQYPNLRLLPYIDDMPAAYGAATIVLTRAGAGTCSELMMIGKPSILVPSPNVAGDHQTKNAAAMAENGASLLISEDELEEKLPEQLRELIFDEEKLEKMSESALKIAKPDADQQIARKLYEIAKRN